MQVINKLNATITYKRFFFSVSTTIRSLHASNLPERRSEALATGLQKVACHSIQEVLINDERI